MSRTIRPGMSVALLLAALAAPSVAAPRLTGEQELAKMIDGRTAGKAEDCLSLTPTMDSQKVEGIGLVYRRGNTLYVNRFQGGCPSLTAFNTVITNTPSTQLCRGDIARLVDLNARIPTGSCVLGPFTPYTKAK